TTSSLDAPTFTGLQGSDTGSATQVFDTKHVGTGKTLSIDGYTINDGNSGANYNVTLETDTTGVITARDLTIAANTDTKIYDATTSSLVAPTFTGLQGSDTGSATQVFDTKHVGTGKTLSIDGYTINDGNSGANYNVTLETDTTGVITARDLTIAANTDTKIYDATTSSLVAPTFTGLQGSDTGSATQVFDTKHVGTGKTLSIDGYTINDGNSGANYNVTLETDRAGVITARDLTIAANTDTKIYDATTSSLVAPTFTGLQGSDTGSATQVFDTKHVGTGK